MVWLVGWLVGFFLVVWWRGRRVEYVIVRLLFFVDIRSTE